MKHAYILTIFLLLLTPFGLQANQIQVPEIPKLERKVYWPNKPRIERLIQVTVEFRVNPCGEVYDVKAVNGSKEAQKFAKYVVSKKLKINPVIKDGKKIDAKLRLPVIIH